MAQNLVARERWQAFFDAVSKAAKAQTVTVEVAGLGLGDQIAADRAAFNGISYDPRDEDLLVFVEGLTHRIRRPATVHVEQVLDTLTHMQVVDEDGLHHVLQFSPVLELPAP